MKTVLLLSIAVATLLACCSRQHKMQNEADKIISSFEILMADTITYNLDIKNADSDDYYSARFLERLNRNALLTSLVNDVLTGKLNAYDYFSGQKLSQDEIKIILKQDDFKNDNFAQLQFQEKWTYNHSTQQLIKNVYSVVLGFEIRDDEGNLKGYKPAFKINLKH